MRCKVQQAAGPAQGSNNSQSGWELQLDALDMNTAACGGKAKQSGRTAKACNCW